MADHAITGEATRSGRKPIPTLKRKADEVLKSVKTTITRKKNISGPTKTKKVSTSKKGKEKAVSPPEDSDIEVIFLYLLLTKD